MKTVLSTLGVLFLATVASAQERIPDEQAQRIAKHLAEKAATVGDAQVKTDVDTDKPFGLKHEEVGVMVLPDRKLSEDILAKAGKDVVPVGQLWFRGIAPVVDNQPASRDKLRFLDITVKDETLSLPVFLLGARKQKDALELVVYGKDKEPLVVVPLQKVESGQGLPIELEGKKSGEDRGELTLNVLGKYQAKVTLAPLN